MWVRWPFSGPHPAIPVLGSSGRGAKKQVFCSSLWLTSSLIMVSAILCSSPPHAYALQVRGLSSSALPWLAM